MRRVWQALLCVSIASVLGCGDPLSLSVTIRGDGVGELGSVELVELSDHPQSAFMQEFTVTRSTVPPGVSEHEVGVLQGLSCGDVFFELRFSGDRPPRPAHVLLEADGQVVIDITSDCSSITCDGFDVPGGLACFEGRCGSIFCDTEDDGCELSLR